VAFLLRRPADDVWLGVRRNGDVEHFDFAVGEQVVDGGVAAREAVQLGDGAGAAPGRARGEAMATGLKPACR